MKRWKVISGGDVFKIGDIVERADGKFGTIVRRTVGPDAFHYVAELIEEFHHEPPPPEPVPVVPPPAPPAPDPSDPPEPWWKKVWKVLLGPVW